MIVAKPRVDRILENFFDLRCTIVLAIPKDPPKTVQTKAPIRVGETGISSQYSLGHTGGLCTEDTSVNDKPATLYHGRTADTRARSPATAPMKRLTRSGFMQLRTMICLTSYYRF